jgi:hypothetical protein
MATGMADRLSALYGLERQGVINNVTITAPGDGARRFTFTVVGDGRERSLKSHELDPFLSGIEVGLSAPRPEPAEEPKPARAAK